MASKRRLRRRMQARQCGAKICYVDQTKALGAALAATHDFGAMFRAYDCRWCHQWHIGRTKQGKLSLRSIGIK